MGLNGDEIRDGEDEDEIRCQGFSLGRKGVDKDREVLRLSAIGEE